MNEMDLTDYVNVAARALFEYNQDKVKWDNVLEGVFKNEIRNVALPVVIAVIEAYSKAHPNRMGDFLDTIG